MENERESIDFGQLLADNIGNTGTELKDMEYGSNQRLNEAKIFDMQAARVLEEFQKSNEIALQEERLEFEKERIKEELILKRNIESERLKADMEKFNKEIALKREIETLRLSIEEKKARNEIRGLWARVLLAGIEVGTGVGLGLLYLKVNMTYGGLIGKDGKKFWDEIRHIKI